MAPYNPGYELSIRNSQGSRNRSSQPQLPASTSDLYSLPLELHYLILAHLDLESLLQLRRTSRLYYHVITTDLVRRLFIRNGVASLGLTACCYECLSTPGLDRLVVDKNIGAFSWQSICFRCWSNRITVDYHINPWPVIQIANGDEGYICQFCNWPVVNNGHDDGVDRLHARCRARRRLVLFVWFVMAFLQFGIGVLCAVLAWTRYKHQPGVLIPSSIPNENDDEIAYLDMRTQHNIQCMNNLGTTKRLEEASADLSLYVDGHLSPTALWYIFSRDMRTDRNHDERFRTIYRRCGRYGSDDDMRIDFTWRVGNLGNEIKESGRYAEVI
ncbi:hypothetical protein CHU98_g178 [Xylaria longipes]|nr:hypothetical protein CHU98_g178 [Xylaria longipes]